MEADDRALTQDGAGSSQVRVVILCTDPSPDATRCRRPHAARPRWPASSIALWSSLALLTTLTAALPPFQVLAIAFGVAGLSGSAWLASGRGGGLAALRQPWPAFALALVALFGYHALYLIAFRHAPAIEVNLINYLWPSLIVVFAAWLLRVPVRAGQVVGTVLAFAGVLLLVTRGEALALRGQFLGGYLAALCAAVLWAAYSVLNRRHAQVPSVAIIGVCIAVAVLAACVHVAFEASVLPTPGQWLALVLMGLGPTGAAFLLWDRGTKAGDIALLGTLSYAAPVLSTLSLLAIGRGTPHWTQAAAVALLLAGVIASTRAAR